VVDQAHKAKKKSPSLLRRLLLLLNKGLVSHHQDQWYQLGHLLLRNVLLSVNQLKLGEHLAIKVKMNNKCALVFVMAAKKEQRRSNNNAHPNVASLQELVLNPSLNKLLKRKPLLRKSPKKKAVKKR
jgi:hypothetical protein